MFGDDPDTTATIVRVGSGTSFGRAREEGRGLMREVRLGLAVGSGLCRRSRAKRREGGPATLSGDRKRPTIDRLLLSLYLSVGTSNELRMR